MVHTIEITKQQAKTKSNHLLYACTE